jgi:cyclase
VNEAALSEIVPGVHAWVQPDGTWWLNNAGAVADPDGGGVLVIDTCATTARTRRFLAAVDAATGGAPVRMAVNTHLHGDHTYGNHVLPASTVVVSHAATREGVLDDPILRDRPPVWSPAPDWSDTAVRPADATFTDAMTVHLGRRRVDLLHPGYTAHTPGDVVAWLPRERVLFTGDLVFHGGTPLVFMGSVAGARRSLEWLASFGAAHVVPGHGAPLAGDALEAVLADHDRYYRFIEETAARGRAAGLSPVEAARAADLGPFAGWSDAERIVLNLHRAYGEAEGRALDLRAALADAVAYNGGPMHCAV